MLGVVIWSAQAESKAIIWCEDHGELAFLGQCPQDSVSAERFDEGDLIQFDLTEYENLRLARNPRRIAQHYCSDLGDVIGKAQSVKTEIEAAKAPEPASQSALIEFDREKRNRSRIAGMAAR